jgi:hypothetical protein
LLRKPIQVGRTVIFSPIAAKVVYAEIIGKNNDDVRARFGGAEGCR